MRLRIRIQPQFQRLRACPGHPERILMGSTSTSGIQSQCENVRGQRPYTIADENNSLPINVSKTEMMTIPMDFRCEARFAVKSPAKLTPQSNRENELECTLVDISATGIGLITKQSLPVNELIVLETERHFVVAKVRHCGPRGDGLRVGLE